MTIKEFMRMRDSEPYVPTCSWCGRDYRECRCGQSKIRRNRYVI